MIIFYPRDFGMWRGDFEFNSKERPSVMFKNVDQLKRFCKDHGVRLDDTEYPFKIEDDNETMMNTMLPVGAKKRQFVVQWTVIGWVEEM